GYDGLARRIFLAVFLLPVALALVPRAAQTAIQAWDRSRFAREQGPELDGRRRAFLHHEGRILVRLASALLIGVALVLGAGLQIEGLADLGAVRLWPLGAASDAPGFHLSQLATLVATFVVTYLIGGLLRGGLDHYVLAWAGMERGLRYSLSSVTYYFVLAVGSVLALTATGLALDDMQWFLAAAGVGIGFGLQEVVSNFVCGILLLLERPLKVGDVIVLDTLEGEVVDVSIRATTLRTWQNVFISVPNKELVTQRLVNVTGSDPRLRLDLPVGVAYGSDLKLVRATLQEVGERHGLVLKDPPPQAVFLRHGESSLDFELRVWVDVGDRLKVTNDLRHALDAAFRRAGIAIPFPQRDVHLHSTSAAGAADAADAVAPA
ncbi:MAG TPA: mechanosensitive ion channel domain-containing protein, partial [Planctomycetota bacterium]|nr:mechanosensitive ion channel domain-containing protein [Planctomycetota bacterium]